MSSCVGLSHHPWETVHVNQWTGIEWQLRCSPYQITHESPWESQWCISVFPLKNRVPDKLTCFKKSYFSTYFASELSFSSVIFFFHLWEFLSPEMKAIRRVSLVDLLFSRDKMLLISRGIYVTVIWNKSLLSGSFDSEDLLLSWYIQRGRFSL